jgi:hypothetical protein
LKGYLVVNSLAELQRLNDNGLLVVAEAAAEADSCRDDDGTSDKQTHWLVPRFLSVDSVEDYIGLSREML